MLVVIGLLACCIDGPTWRNPREKTDQDWSYVAAGPNDGQYFSGGPIDSHVFALDGLGGNVAAYAPPPWTADDGTQFPDPPGYKYLTCYSDGRGTICSDGGKSSNWSGPAVVGNAP